MYRLMLAQSSLLMRSEPHPVSMSHALTMPATTGAAFAVESPPKFTTMIWSFSASLLHSLMGFPLSCVTSRSAMGTFPRCIGLPFTSGLWPSASVLDSRSWMT